MVTLAINIAAFLFLAWVALLFIGMLVAGGATSRPRRLTRKEKKAAAFAKDSYEIAIRVMDTRIDELEAERYAAESDGANEGYYYFIQREREVLINRRYEFSDTSINPTWEGALSRLEDWGGLDKVVTPAPRPTLNKTYLKEGDPALDLIMSHFDENNRYLISRDRITEDLAIARDIRETFPESNTRYFNLTGACSSGLDSISVRVNGTQVSHEVEDCI